MYSEYQLEYLEKTLRIGEICCHFDFCEKTAVKCDVKNSPCVKKYGDKQKDEKWMASKNISQDL